MKFRRELDPLKPYNPPWISHEAKAERGEGDYVKLTANELSFGPLPEAEAAISEALPRLNRYPDRHAAALRAAISGANAGIRPENVVVGNGSSEVLLNLLQLVERPGEVVFPWPSFSLYATIARIVGLEARRVPLRPDHAVDPDALLAALTPKTRAVILCNPNNPTGTHLKLEEVRAIADRLPEDVLLILDEAYYEFVDDPSYPGSHELALSTQSVVCVRTFSKVHGLAALRVGYGLAPREIADYAERVRFPFSVNLAAQVAAAASMGAPERIAKRASFVIEERTRLQRALDEAGVEYVPSQANFVLAKIEPAVFRRAGVLVREGDALGYPGWSRITIGNSAENDRVISAFSGR
ncbi:histidinol-phosphate transaminase [Rubrobacter calidifluminis]|uniref:histidinol-phosphate transaminase n=1 Tax=Rubrobacter calidifluminis TaxID=1392640 RepID=UPI0023622AC4|nr:histidinol-phosphate transaminase [Rubrobacter calidifluminis]